MDRSKNQLEDFAKMQRGCPKGVDVLGDIDGVREKILVVGDF